MKEETVEVKVFEPIEITFEPLPRKNEWWYVSSSIGDPYIEELEDEYFDRLEVDP